MSILNRQLQNALDGAVADTRRHLDESNPLEFKIELEENIHDRMIHAGLASNAYTAIITGIGETLSVVLTVTLLNGDRHTVNNTKIPKEAQL